MTTLPPDLISDSILLTSDRHLAAFANHVRTGLGAGDTLLLSGPIGAGKSHFARSLIQGLLRDCDAIEDIPSPTFTLVQTYQAGKLEIWHSDLYRLNHVDEVVELGLSDAFTTALCLVEWPDRLGRETPDGALHLRFDLVANPDHRLLTLTFTSQKWLWISDSLAIFNALKGPVDA